MTFATPLFEPAPQPEFSPAKDGERPPEQRDAYAFHDERVVTAVNVALATRRPLLVTGEPGSGKSSLALAVARELAWSYAEKVVTSRTELADLTAGFDAVRRLADSQLKDEGLLASWAYVEPGVLWWAFDPGRAETRGHTAEEVASCGERLPPTSDARISIATSTHDIVVLLDEIDKAEPDLPNDLLAPLDRFAFDVPGVGSVEAKGEVLVVITSNRERRLPPAFLRRCVQLELETTDKDVFVTVARAHFGPREAGDDLYDRVAVEFWRYREAAKEAGRREPSTAEFLDTLRACLKFGESPGSPNWLGIVEVALWKSATPPEELPEYVGDED
jgi:MoxR-like ATPase